MKTSLKYYMIGMSTTILLWLFLFPKGCTSSNREISTIITDTIFVDKPYKEIVIKEVEIPQTIFVYNTDTVYRKKMEKDTLITSVEFRKEIARVHTISPKGIPTIAEYSLQNVKSLSIDHQGKIQLKKRKHPKLRKAFKRAGQLLIFVGGVWVGKLIKG